MSETITETISETPHTGKRRRISIFHGDVVIWLVFLFLCLISVVEVFSASSTLSFKTHNYMAPITYHVGTLIVGIVFMLVATAIPCKYYKLLTIWLLLLSFGTLIWVLAGGESINGANRVIRLPGFTFQPSEIAKGTMVLFTAQVLAASQREDGKGADTSAMHNILFVLVPMLLLIGTENLSTAGLLFAVVFIMMFIGRVPMQQMGKLLGVLLLCGAIIFGIGALYGEGDEAEDGQEETTELVVADGQEAVDGDAATDKAKKSKPWYDKVFHRFATWKNRIISHSNSEDVPPEEYDVMANYQVTHANFAISSAGFLGKGPGNSVERDYLPQAFSDFIYAIIIEETGLLGAFGTALLYVILLLRCYKIAQRCENNFPAFLIMGLAILLVLQAVINMMVAVGLMPVTGQPLPLVSKGGTSTIVSCIYIGAILSVSRWAKRSTTPGRAAVVPISTEQPDPDND